MHVFLPRLLLLLTLVSNTVIASTSGHALVIGNADYVGETPLVNTLNDARDMAAKLESLGFTVDRVENAGRRELTRAVSDFLRRIHGSDAPALVYYSGHGMQIGGHNYLLPVDARIRDAFDVRSEGVGIDQVLAGMGGRGDDAINLVVLDACRNNPFKQDGDKAIGDKGLARVSAPSGTLILYATKPGDVASDNPQGRNGLFTKHLLRAMDEPGVQVEETFKQVAQNVYRDSRRRQSPWQEGVIYGRFYFVPPPPVPVGPPPPVAVPQPAVDYDYAAWQSAERCGRRVCFRAYLQQYPNGRFAPMAGALLAAAERVEPPRPPRPPPDPAQPGSAQPDSVQELAVQLNSCHAHLDANRLTTGAGGNALACYQGVLERAPGNRAALAGLDAIAKRYGDWADSNLQRGRLDRVERYLERMATVSPDSPRLAELQERLQAAREPTARVQVAARPAEVARHSFEPEMVRIPGGSFRMGSNNGESYEKPIHSVTLKPFLVGKYEVTQAQWRAVMGNNPSYFSGCDRCPVEKVSWDEVQTYIRKLNAKTGKTYRLPSEAEWEYACRSGGREQEYCGGDDPGSLAWYDANSGKTHPVGRKRANGLGLHDMSGNVWEWCADWLGEYPAGPLVDPAGPQTGVRRVLRGGSWFNDARGLRSARRYGFDPGYRHRFIGFRLTLGPGLRQD